MRSVLISIRPKWCELIAKGQKTVEVRKTRPKLETPFKVYIYMTAGDAVYPVTINGSPYTCSNVGGKCVIGEFVCKRIDRIGKRGINNNFDYCYLSLNEFGNDDIEIEIKDIKNSCVSKEELNSYGANSPFLYCFHISNLEIYDTPKCLSEFSGLRKTKFGYEPVSLTRPPQSWCYVEEVSQP